MSISIFEQIEAMKRSAEILIEAAAEHDAENEEILAAEWEESKYKRDNSGRFSGGGGSKNGPKASGQMVQKGDKGSYEANQSAVDADVARRKSSSPTPENAAKLAANRAAAEKAANSPENLYAKNEKDIAKDMSDRAAKAKKAQLKGNLAKGAAAAAGLAVGGAVAYQNKESIQSGLATLGDKASAAKIGGAAAAIDGVKGMETKVKGAMAGLSKKLGMDGSKDAGKSGGEHLMESVSKMGGAMKSGSQKAMQLTAARAATAVAAAQNGTVRKAFVDELKKAKNGEEMIGKIHQAAAAIDTVAHVKVGTDNAKKAIGEHAADIEKGTAAAVGLGVAVMATKKFGQKGANKKANFRAKMASGVAANDVKKTGDALKSAKDAANFKAKQAASTMKNTTPRSAKAAKDKANFKAKMAPAVTAKQAKQASEAIDNARKANATAGLAGKMFRR